MAPREDEEIARPESQRLPTSGPSHAMAALALAACRLALGLPLSSLEVQGGDEVGTIGVHPRGGADGLLVATADAEDALLVLASALAWAQRTQAPRPRRTSM